MVSLEITQVNISFKNKLNMWGKNDKKINK